MADGSKEAGSAEIPVYSYPYPEHVRKALSATAELQVSDYFRLWLASPSGQRTLKLINASADSHSAFDAATDHGHPPAKHLLLSPAKGAPPSPTGFHGRMGVAFSPPLSPGASRAPLSPRKGSPSNMAHALAAGIEDGYPTAEEALASSPGGGSPRSGRFGFGAASHPSALHGSVPFSPTYGIKKGGDGSSPSSSGAAAALAASGVTSPGSASSPTASGVGIALRVSPSAATGVGRPSLSRSFSAGAELQSPIKIAAMLTATAEAAALSAPAWTDLGGDTAGSSGSGATSTPTDAAATGGSGAHTVSPVSSDPSGTVMSPPATGLTSPHRGEGGSSGAGIAAAGLPLSPRLMRSISAPGYQSAVAVASPPQPQVASAVSSPGSSPTLSAASSPVAVRSPGSPRSPASGALPPRSPRSHSPVQLGPSAAEAAAAVLSASVARSLDAFPVSPPRAVTASAAAAVSSPPPAASSTLSPASLNRISESKLADAEQESKEESKVVEEEDVPRTPLTGLSGSSASGSSSSGSGSGDGAATALATSVSGPSQLEDGDEALHTPKRVAPAEQAVETSAATKTAAAAGSSAAAATAPSVSAAARVTAAASAAGIPCFFQKGNPHAATSLKQVLKRRHANNPNVPAAAAATATRPVRGAVITGETLEDRLSSLLDLFRRHNVNTVTPPQPFAKMNSRRRSNSISSAVSSKDGKKGSLANSKSAASAAARRTSGQGLGRTGSRAGSDSETEADDGEPDVRVTVDVCGVKLSWEDAHLAVSVDNFPALAKPLCGFPSFFAAPLFRRVKAQFGGVGNAHGRPVVPQEWQAEAAASSSGSSSKAGAGAAVTAGARSRSGSTASAAAEERVLRMEVRENTPTASEETDRDTGGVVTLPMFCAYWRAEMERCDAVERFFNLVKQRRAQAIAPPDFMPFLEELLAYHPGLAFLENTPEFQEKYARTVIARVFYVCDLAARRHIDLRALRASNVLQAFNTVDVEEDINQVMEYFSYEHFYVLYCKFWELDTDHDFLLSRGDLSRLTHLTSAILDRVVSAPARPFSSGTPNRMGYEDFIIFYMACEDKTTPAALKYWFDVCDVDGDGVLTPDDLRHFYGEQSARMRDHGMEVVKFEDVVCQFHDLLQPAVEGHILLSDFLHPTRVKLTGVLFNALFDLDKFQRFEGREAAMVKQGENMAVSQWARFAAQEYRRLASEEEEVQSLSNNNSWVVAA